jgi:hypothetical protein
VSLELRPCGLISAFQLQRAVENDLKH